MLLDRKKYTESGYIADELFSNGQEDLLDTFMIVKQAIADGDFSPEEAFEAYQVSREEYENFIAKQHNNDIKAYFSGTNEKEFSVFFIEVINKMVSNHFYDPIYESQVKRAVRELNRFSDAVTRKKTNV
jgi:hypothetical protein